MIFVNEGIESGKITVKVLTTNETSVTLLTDEKFNGVVVQPEANANRLLAEHGLALSITITENGAKHTFLLDAGGLSSTILENSKQLSVNLKEVEKLVLSHGHFDHFGGLVKIMAELKEGAEFYVNPNCFFPNYVIVTKSGEELTLEDINTNLRKLDKEGKLKMNKKLPPLNRDQINNLAAQLKIKVIETKEPVGLYRGVTTSGEIELFDRNEVSKGFFLERAKKEFEKHTFRDETAIYIHVKDKGLVILTGCGHTGIVNTIKHGQKITGVDKVYAVIGGFHKEYESDDNIDNAVKFLEGLNPAIVCGMHCTGFKFNKSMSRNPSHTLGVVGTEFRL